MTDYVKGLDGVITGESKLGFIDGEKALLAYCGYPVQVLAENSTYLETTYLLLYGKLPNKKELDILTEKISQNRELPKKALDIIHLFPPHIHSMESLQAVVSLLPGYNPDPVGERGLDTVRNQVIKLVAQFPTIVAACWRAKNKKEILAPNPKLDHASNFLYMVTGKNPDPEEAKMFDVCLILHAEHGFNASTFTARVCASSLPSLHASIAAAIGSLYGPLHGGANEKVLEMIAPIQNAESAEKWVLDTFARKEKIIGFGHRVYTVKDPRAYILEDMLAKLSKKKKNTKSYDILKKIESVTCREMEKLGKKNIWPNVDFFSGALYDLMSIPSAVFTPVFAMARIAGWGAHVMEQLSDNRIFRPDCLYTGLHDMTYSPLEKR